MRSPQICLALLVLLGLGLPSLLQAQRPAGPPFQVNVRTAGLQALADLAMNARGEFVVTWIDIPDGSAERSILARRFAADGTPLTGEILVAHNPADSDPAKAVVMDDGSFVVVFPAFPDLAARRYSPDGGFLGESVVARHLQSGQYAAAARPGGGFALAWMGEYGLVVTTRLFGPDGEPDGPERRLGLGRSPSIAVGPDGESIVTWLFELFIPNQEHIGDFYLFGQRFGVGGRPLGERIAVQGRLRGFISGVQVAKDGQGDFLVLWKAAGVLQEGGTRSNQVGVFVRRFDADGTPLTGPLKVAGDRADVPRLAMDQSGNFDVAWSTSGVFVRRFTPEGIPFRPALAVDPAGRLPLVASAANGNFVLVWSGFSEEILGQRFRRR